MICGGFTMLSQTGLAESSLRMGLTHGRKKGETHNNETHVLSFQELAASKTYEEQAGEAETFFKKIRAHRSEANPHPMGLLSNSYVRACPSSGHLFRP